MFWFVVIKKINKVEQVTLMSNKRIIMRNLWEQIADRLTEMNTVFCWVIFLKVIHALAMKKWRDILRDITQNRIINSGIASLICYLLLSGILKHNGNWAPLLLLLFQMARQTLFHLQIACSLHFSAVASVLLGWARKSIES